MNIYLIIAAAAFAVVLPLDIYLIIKFGALKSKLLFIFRKKDQLFRCRFKQFKNSLPKKEMSPSLEKACRFLRKHGFNPIMGGYFPFINLLQKTRMSFIIAGLTGYIYGGKWFLVALIASFVVIYEASVQALISRKNKAEEQVIDFVKKIELLSSQYSNIAEMFGIMYQDFEGDFSLAIAYCHLEYLETNDRNIATRHFQEFFFSPVVSLAINNALSCMDDKRDLELVSRLSSECLKNYTEEAELRREFVKKTKVSLTIALAMFGILTAASFFMLGGTSNISYILKVAKIPALSGLAVCTYLYGMNLER